MMVPFRAKAVQIMAVQLTRELLEAALFTPAPLPPGCSFRGTVNAGERDYSGNVWCNSRQGAVRAEVGDWIIAEPGEAGMSYPCAPDVFAAKYEAVDESPGG